MKNFSFFIALLFSLNIYSQQDYIIKINDEHLEVELDKEYPMTIDGKEFLVSISTKDTLTFQDDMFSFQYPKEYKISKIDLGDGIYQFVLINAEGSGFAIQKYTTMNPTMLNEMMLSELTKESLSYGFKMEKQDYVKQLISGNEVNITRAILTYKDETNVYEVMSVGKKDEGLMLITMTMDEEMSSESEKLISMMWNSLQIH